MKKCFALVMTVLTLMTLLISCDDEDATRIDDVNMYIEESYYTFDREDLSWKYSAGRAAYGFFPPYNELEFNYSDLNFYVYNYAGLTYPETTIILELKFDDKQAYDEASTEIHSTYKFLEAPVKGDLFSTEMPRAEYQIGGFLVKIITQGEQNNFPHSVYAICENDNEMVLRYLYIYDMHTDGINERGFINGIVEHSNCSW